MPAKSDAFKKLQGISPTNNNKIKKNQVSRYEDLTTIETQNEMVWLCFTNKQACQDNPAMHGAKRLEERQTEQRGAAMKLDAVIRKMKKADYQVITNIFTVTHPMMIISIIRSEHFSFNQIICSFCHVCVSSV